MEVIKNKIILLFIFYKIFNLIKKINDNSKNSLKPNLSNLNNYNH